MKETPVQQRILLEAAEQGVTLWRNNVGVCQTADGRTVRFGLANESERMNREIKSSDLIGVKPMLILPEHVGRIVGVFCCIEAKHSDWKYTGTEREIAQSRFITHHRQLGAVGGFCNDPSQLSELLRF